MSFKQLLKNALLTTALCCAATSAFAHGDGDHHHHDSPLDHAPIGVMADHVHAEGEWMFSYRMAYMHMEDMRDGTDRLSSQDVLNNYMVAPTEMPMQMHMLGAMYGVTDQLTLAAMGGFVMREMDHIRRNGSTFTMENEGITDTRVSALYEFYNDGQHRLQFNAGLSLPTGDVNDRKPNGGIFGYPMQVGSGTYDLLPGISYTGVDGQWSWGGQLNATLRLGENNRGYAYGDRLQFTTWGARELNEMFSVSLRLDAHSWDTIHGRDRELQGPNFMAPPMDAELHGGERVDALVGVNFVVPSGTLKGHRLAAEFGAPVYQNLDGPQMETDYRFILGWQKAF
jgi:hypothetical protein